MGIETRLKIGEMEGEIVDEKNRRKSRYWKKRNASKQRYSYKNLSVLGRRGGRKKKGVKVRKREGRKGGVMVGKREGRKGGLMVGKREGRKGERR